MCALSVNEYLVRLLTENEEVSIEAVRVCQEMGGDSMKLIPNIASGIEFWRDLKERAQRGELMLSDEPHGRS
jgi:hypothetical protein